MSGLFGVVGFSGAPLEPESLRRLAQPAAWRGPGGMTCQILEGAGLAHFALHPAADRPLLRRRCCVLLDGRLDNRRELLARLSPPEGAEASDTELVFAAYLEWGEACAGHLLGDFAFALWDADRRRLLCAVDPLGIKPLHYAPIAAGLCFASDAVMVLQHPAVPDEYDAAEIASYLAGRCENPARSFFAAVHRLAPGHFLVAEAGGVRTERYWSPRPAEIRYARDEDYADHFREIFERAVTDRLRGSGSSVAIALSGGLDSGSVAAVAHRSGAKVRAYTFAFDRLPECDERSYSRALSEELGLEIEPVGAEDLWELESRARLPHSPDTPFVGWRTSYGEILRRMQARGSRVLLMGHGGDDVMRGSSRIYLERLLRGDLAALREVARDAKDRRESIPRSFYRQFARPLLAAAREGRRPPPVFASPARREVYTHLVEIPWYWRLANWHDRNAAGFGIEVRHPFLDRRLFEYVLAIPGDQLFRIGRPKDLLRRSMRGVLPERIRLRQGKTRFTPFLDEVMRKRSAGEIAELLREPRAAELGFVDKDHLWSSYLDFLDEGSSESRRTLWYAITLEIWLRRCEAIRRDRRRVAVTEQAAA